MTRRRRMPVAGWVIAAGLTLCCVSTYAVGLGSIQVRSALGQPLRASVALLGPAIENPETCVRTRLESADGVFIAAAQVGVTAGTTSSALTFSTTRSVDEPAVTLFVDIGCGTAIHREYQILLDPPTRLASIAEPAAPATAIPDTPRKNNASNNSSQTAAVHASASPAQSAADGPILPAPAKSRKHARKHQNEQEPAALKTPAAKPRHARKTQDVLRLSDPVESTNFGLKLDDNLSQAPAETEANLPRQAEMQKAQARFAAILRGEDPLQNMETQVQTAQARLQALQLQAAQAERQDRADKVALTEMREKMFSANWVVGLSVVVLACLGALGWLGWRFYALRQNTLPPWWEKTAAAENTQNPPAVEEDGDDDDSMPTPVTKGWSDSATFSISEERIDLDHGDLSLPVVPVTGVEADAVRSGRKSEGNRYPFHDPGVTQNIDGMLNYTYPTRAEIPKVEEISDVLQEAEFWLSLNDPQRAVAVLEPCIEIDRPTSPAPWLYLLDLYSDLKKQEKYQALREQFRHLFNLRIPAWDERTDETSVQGQGLEDYPHLLEKTCELWSSPEVVTFLESLLLDNRDGTRAGFDLSVYRDIMLLIHIAHDAAAPVTE